MGLCPVCWWEDDGQEDADASEVRLTVNGQSEPERGPPALRAVAARPTHDFSVTFVSPMSLSSNVPITVLLRGLTSRPV